MSAPPIRFQDGAAYERGMAGWSRLAGRIFLEWMAPEPGLAWLDVGCGNGAFTELVLDGCAPSEVQGIDPSAGQIDFARGRGLARAEFQIGDALALPFEAARFDVSVMALVVFFLPDPEAGVREMVRAVRPGGRVAAYAWDFEAEGFPFRALLQQLRAEGISPPQPPRPEAGTVDGLRALWDGAGLHSVEQRVIDVQRQYDSFEAFWDSANATGSVLAMLAERSPAEVEAFKAGVRAQLPPADANGRYTLTARANAIIGRV